MGNDTTKKSMSIGAISSTGWQKNALDIAGRSWMGVVAMGVACGMGEGIRRESSESPPGFKKCKQKLSMIIALRQ